MSMLEVLEAMGEPEGERVLASQKPSTQADRGDAIGWGDEAKTTDRPTEHEATTDNDSSEARAEVDAMQREAPLLDLIRSDTGEKGEDRGAGVVYFKTCPVCGHHDCFRYYSTSNTWSCFGASNASGYDGGGYLEYQKAAHQLSDVEAMKRLRDSTGHDYRDRAGKVAQDAGNIGAPGRKADGKDNDSQPRYFLPEPMAIQAANPPKRAPHLLGGLLRRGHTALGVARSKSFKSWDAIALCVCVSCGIEWHGIETGEGMPCVFLDPEIDWRTLSWRFHMVAEALGADTATVDERVMRWSLRGAITPSGDPPTMADVVHDVRARVAAGAWERGQFALVVIDSCSCLLQGDENASGDVRRFHNLCLEVAEALDASVFCIQHEGLAETGSRDAINRARGSSVWADSFDLILSLARAYPPSGDVADYLSEGEAAFVLEVGGNREFSPSEPIRLVWSFPAFRIDHDGVTDGWTLNKSQQDGASRTNDRQREKSKTRAAQCVAVLLAHMLSEGTGRDGIPAKEAAEVCTEGLGEAVNTQTLKAYVDGSELLDVWQKSRNRWFVVPRHLPPEHGQAERLAQIE